MPGSMLKIQEQEILIKDYKCEVKTETTKKKQRVNRESYMILTLRLLMSYIYIYMKRIFLMFLDHTQRRTTVGRTPLDE